MVHRLLPRLPLGVGREAEGSGSEDGDGDRPGYHLTMHRPTSSPTCPTYRRDITAGAEDYRRAWDEPTFDMETTAVTDVASNLSRGVSGTELA